MLAHHLSSAFLHILFIAFCHRGYCLCKILGINILVKSIKIGAISLQSRPSLGKTGNLSHGMGHLKRCSRSKAHSRCVLLWQYFFHPQSSGGTGRSLLHLNRKKPVNCFIPRSKSSWLTFYRALGTIYPDSFELFACAQRKEFGSSFLEYWPKKPSHSKSSPQS